MSSGVPRIAPSNVRSLPGMGRGPSIPGFAPLPPKRGGSSRWLLWLVLVPLLLLALLYLLGRTVEPVRQRLESVPLAGKLLFADQVWPILWNKPVSAKGADPTAAKTAPAGNGTAAGDKSTGDKGVTQQGTAGKAGLSPLEAEIAARLAAVEVRENEVARREAALKTSEPATADKQRKLDQGLAEVGALRVQLQGQLRMEQDRVAVIRAMKSASVVQLFGAMTDDEIITVLKYMTADEVGKIMSGMDPYRSARILHRMAQIAPSQTNP